MSRLSGGSYFFGVQWNAISNNRTKSAAAARLHAAVSRLMNVRFQPLRYLHDCSDCFRLERLPGGIFTHWKAPPLHGARQ
jgi:hypothetical protein